MYLMTIHVPIYLDGERKLLTTEWKKSLEMLRDSLQDRLGRLTVAAPWYDVATIQSDQQLEPVSLETDGIDLRPAIPYEHRARDYWWTYRKQWLDHCRPLQQRARDNSPSAPRPRGVDERVG